MGALVFSWTSASGRLMYNPVQNTAYPGQDLMTMTWASRKKRMLASVKWKKEVEMVVGILVAF